MPLKFTLPERFSAEDSGFFAERLTEVSSYNVKAQGTTWSISSKRAFPAFLALPFLRDEVLPEEIRVKLEREAFQGIRYWPPGPLGEAERRAAGQGFISAANTWTVDQFFQIRDKFAALLSLPSADALLETLPVLARTVKTALPNASVDVIRTDPEVLAAASLARFLALIPRMTPDELRALSEADPRGRGGPHYYFTPEPYFELLANINYPRTVAFGIRFGLEAYVILDYGMQLTLEPLDSNERLARDVGARVLLAPRKGAFETKAFPDYSHATRHFMRAWLTQRLNFLFAHLTALHAAPRDADGNVVTVDLWKDLLTVEDIVGLTQIVATTSDQAVLRLVFFDLIDRYGQLGGGQERKTNDILNDQFIRKLADSLGDDLADLRPTLRDWLLESWSRVCDEAWEGVVSPRERAARTFDVSLPGESERSLEGSEFVSSWLHAMRNTTHGYHLRGGTFERYLTRHESVLPSAVRELSIALWLCFMASPQLFWGTPSRFSTLRMVDLMPRKPASPDDPGMPA